jgi:hypothetical protein
MYIKVSLLAVAVALLAATAEARVYSLQPTQTITFANPGGAFAAPKVAIDDDAAIAIMDGAGVREALLFRRDANRRWVFARTLLSVPASSRLRNELTMDFGRAAILLDDVLHIFERAPSGDWVESATAGTPRAAGGLSISSSVIMAGRLGCNDDIDVFEKSRGSGVWRITGRVAGAPGACDGATFDQNSPYVIVRNPGEEARVHVRNGEFNWPQVATFSAPAGVTLGDGPHSANGIWAVFDGGATFRTVNFDLSQWSYHGQLRALNYANGPGAADPHFRIGYMTTLASLGHPRETRHVYVYRETENASDLEHHAVLHTPGDAAFADIAALLAPFTVVASGLDADGGRFISFFELPTDPSATAYANDFTTHDPAAWQQTPGSQFALASIGGNAVYRQSSLAGEAQAHHAGIDWRLQQSVEADITPTAVDGPDRWVGLAVRYLDANNHYYVTLRSSNVIQLKRKVAGVFTTLAEAPLPFSLGTRRHVKLIVNADVLTVFVDGQQRLLARDAGLTHGSIALLTYRARADFDNVYASPTVPFNLALKDFTDLFDPGRPFSVSGGNWTPVEGPGGEIAGRAQTSTTGDARAIIGTETDDQSVAARLRLDRYNASPQGAWLGLFARWRDARTHYYLALRSTNRLEIRKQVNGAITVLASVPFTATPGRFYDLKFTALRDELHAYVDGRLVAQALDGDIATGQYGLGTYRTAATFQRFEVDQP